ncbi:CBS domain-containing protein [Halorhabdus sp. BNX81]|uniref:CBS domain-containing protein n=1 Tax=Halorhabdus sp. BNX81 TaxID=2980181 RepID=UPI0023DD4073|nr:CBS domain-containing protein [Halorhabdus sp. BNX81]WEL18927.1 CBS domain [Halorhabdus sp. SVX81]
MLIRDVMSTDYLTVSRDRSLRAAVEILLKDGRESIIITDGDDPDGLITQRSALIACYKTDDPLSEIPVSGFASGFPTSVKPDATVLFAIGQLINADTDVLPVVEGLELVGVVTREDMLNEYTNLRNEAFNTVEQRKDWGPE